MKIKDTVPCREPNHARETPVTLNTILVYKYKKVASDFWNTLVINENGNIPTDSLDDVLTIVLKRKGLLHTEVTEFVTKRYIEMAQDNDGSVSPDKNIGE
jgi:hypothetical protein